MELRIKLESPDCADGIYQIITAKGFVMASLRWGDASGALEDWTELAVIPIGPDGRGAFTFTGGRAIPPEATHVYAKAVHQDMCHFETAAVSLPPQQGDKFCGNGLRFAVLSDFHLSKTPLRGRRALLAGKDCRGVLLLGDLTNDGFPEQFQLLREGVEELLPDVPVLSTAGNHDFPFAPVGQEEYYSPLEAWLLSRAEELGLVCQRDPSGAYGVEIEGVDVIGLNAVTHGRKFLFPGGAQLRWLERRLQETPADWHIILCHAPLLRHNPQRDKDIHPPYLDRDRELQEIVDACPNLIFLSGHTHLSYNCPRGCVDADGGRLYINAASICPATLKSEEPLLPAAWTDPTITELYIERARVRVTARSLADGRKFARGYYVFPSMIPNESS